MRYGKPYRFWKRGKYFYYRLPGTGKWKSTGKTTEPEAHRYLIEEVLPNPQKKERATKLKNYALPAFDKYVEAREKVARDPLSEKYVSVSRGYLKRFLLNDELAEKPIRDLTMEDWEDFQTRLITHVLPDHRTTAVRALEAVRLVLRRAEKQGLVKVSPDRAAVKPKADSRQRDTYTAEEMEKLFPADVWEKGDFGPWQEPLDYTAFIIAASTGMRKGEVLALEWSDVHLEEGQEYLEIRGSLQTTTQIGPTKGKRPRATPVFDFVLWTERRAVRALSELRKRSGKIVDMQGQPMGPVFVREDGSRLGRTWWQTRMKSALKKANIKRDRGENSMPLDTHSLRHTLASHLKAAGMPDDLIRRFCGWSSLNVQARYTHIEPELFTRIMNLVQVTVKS